MNGPANGIVVFAPAPVLTVTIEDQGGEPDIHLHAGGQGVWQARMLVTLGASATICAVLSGETGRVAHHLLEDEGIAVRAIAGSGRNGAYVHDRRGGERVEIADAGTDPLARHDLDELYGLTLSAAINAGAVVLSGTAEPDTIPVDIYRRLAADLRAVGRPVLADLSGDRLTAVLSGGVSVIKVSDEELLADGRVSKTDEDALVAAMYQMHDEGASNVIVTRSGDPVLVLSDNAVSEVGPPKLQAADSHGAGDSLTAGVAVILAKGGTMEDAVRLGAAAGTMNVTRHGLGTGEVEAVLKLRELVHVRTLEHATRPSERLSPGDLARRVKES